MTVLGLMAGAAFAHNFGLASSGEGPTANGKIAVIIGIVVVAVIAAVNSMRKKKPDCWNADIISAINTLTLRKVFLYTL